MTEVTRILAQIDSGDANVAEQLLPLVYDELRRLAAIRLAQEPYSNSLQATALVHDAFLRLAGAQHANTWNSRGHFFAAAAQAMRRILVERARHKRQLKRGGGRRRQELYDLAAPEPDQHLIELDDALTRFALEDPVAARVVELRYFARLGHESIARSLGISVYQARQKWTYARAWLLHDLQSESNIS